MKQTLSIFYVQWCLLKGFILIYLNNTNAKKTLYTLYEFNSHISDIDKLLTKRELPHFFLFFSELKLLTDRYGFQTLAGKVYKDLSDI